MQSPKEKETVQAVKDLKEDGQPAREQVKNQTLNTDAKASGQELQIATQLQYFQRDSPIVDFNKSLELGNPSLPAIQNQEPAIIDCDGELQNLPKKRKMKKQRKVRTLITKEKLLEMNKIFYEFLNKTAGFNEHWNLKSIANHLELGYSTILHKFREFRANKKVKAGALIASMQKKRKYKKSLVVQNLIKQVMNEKEFFTASEMTEYIETRFSKKFSRSIISRHLGEMGYSYKNVSHGNSNHETKFLKMRKTYAEIMKPLIERNETFIYIDEMSCCEKEVEGRESKTVSILIACTIYGVLYFHIQEGFINREKFYLILKEFLINLRESPLCKNIQGENEELYLVVDASSIHRDSNTNAYGLATMLIEENTDIYYIPPNSPEFNPLEPIFENIRLSLAARIRCNQITDFESLWQNIEMILEQVKMESTEDYFVDMCSQLEKYMPTDLKN